MSGALGSIDLTNYSASPGWAGYFDAKKDIHRRASAQEAIAILERYIHRHPQKITMCTSLHCSFTEKQLRGLGYYADEARKLYAHAVNGSGLIRLVETDHPDDLYSYDMRCIDFSNETQTGLMVVSQAIMAQNVMNGGFFGNFFIVFEGSGLIIYPHDDGGFGAFDSQQGLASHAFFTNFPPAGFEVFLQARHAPIENSQKPV